jgi:tetratricopeptide (TPR) repeat protein
MVRMQWGRAAIHGRASDVARRELEAACKLLRKGGRHASIARGLYYLGGLEYALGNLDEVERIASEALALGGECDEAEVRMIVHNLCGTIANMRNDFGRAETHLRKGLAAARELGAPSAIGGLLCALGVPLYYAGHFDESCAVNEEAARLYEMLHKNATASLVRSNLASLELARGNAAAAYRHAEIAVRLDRETGDELQLAGSLVNLADACFQQADIARAREALDEGLRLADRLPLTLSDALRLVAEIDLRAGDFAAALTAIARLRDVLAEHRLEVRVPMLILVTADYAMSAQDETASAFRWLDALARLDAVDASLRDKARAALARAAGSSANDPTATSAPSSAEIEREVLAYLDRVAPRADAR